MINRMSLMTILASFVAFGTACSQEGGDSGPDELRGDVAGDLTELDPARSSWEGTPEGVGLVEFLNDEATTFELLDITVALDRRGAGNLIAHRDGGDRLWGTTDDDVYNTVDEIDAVRYVGPASIDRMVAHAAKVGWVPGAEDILGVYDGVSFTVDQAAATLALANALSQDELDDAYRLHARAAESIAIAQPIATIDELSRLYYVGRSALSRLKDAAATADINQQD
jgi:hypothetical protein